LNIAGQDWDCFAQHGRMVFQDGDGLLDLPQPALRGPHQIGNAGNAIAVLRCINDQRISDEHVAMGLKNVAWPGRLQLLKGGALSALLDAQSELWLDGGHNADAGVVLAEALTSMPKKPLVIIWGMLNTKDATTFFKPLAEQADHVMTLAIPGEANGISAADLARTVQTLGVTATATDSIENAIRQASLLQPAVRILICGSLYLAGHVLAAEQQTEMSNVSGAAKR
jgi:dihydrofolate synthase / folylpolyglutamate synthase